MRYGDGFKQEKSSASEPQLQGYPFGLQNYTQGNESEADQLLKLLDLISCEIRLTEAQL